VAPRIDVPLPDKLAKTVDSKWKAEHLSVPDRGAAVRQVCVLCNQKMFMSVQRSFPLNQTTGFLYKKK